MIVLNAYTYHIIAIYKAIIMLHLWLPTFFIASSTGLISYPGYLKNDDCLVFNIPDRYSYMYTKPD